MESFGIGPWFRSVGWNTAYSWFEFLFCPQIGIQGVIDVSGYGFGRWICGHVVFCRQVGINKGGDRSADLICTSELAIFGRRMFFLAGIGR